MHSLSSVLLHLRERSPVVPVPLAFPNHSFYSQRAVAASVLRCVVVYRRPYIERYPCRDVHERPFGILAPVGSPFAHVIGEVDIPYYSY